MSLLDEWVLRLSSEDEHHHRETSGLINILRSTRQTVATFKVVLLTIQQLVEERKVHLFG